MSTKTFTILPAVDISGADVIAQWYDLSEDRQIQILGANVKKAAKNEIGYSNEDHYNEFNEDVAWFLQHHGIDCLVNEAWLKLMDRLDPVYLENLNTKRAEHGHTPITLVALVYRSAKDAIRAVYATDIKHGRARVHTIKDDKTGEDYSYIDTMATNPKDNVENTVMYKMSMDDFLKGLDDIDRVIVLSIYDGKTQKEIAKDVGISAVAISKRLKKIRKALISAGFAAAAAV